MSPEGWGEAGREPRPQGSWLSGDRWHPPLGPPRGRPLVPAQPRLSECWPCTPAPPCSPLSPLTGEQLLVTRGSPRREAAGSRAEPARQTRHQMLALPRQGSLSCGRPVHCPRTKGSLEGTGHTERPRGPGMRPASLSPERGACPPSGQASGGCGVRGAPSALQGHGTPPLT